MRAMIRKEVAQLRRDRRTAALIMVVPLLLLIVFGYAASFDVESARTVVVGPDAAAVAARLPEAMAVVDTEADGGRGRAEELLRRHDVDAVVLTDGPQVLLDGTQLFAVRSVQTALARGDGQTSGASPGADRQPEVLFNPTLDSRTVMVPALVGLILLFIGTVATSLGVVRERQAGTLEQLAVMPFRPLDVLVGKLVPYLVLAVVDMLAVVTVGVLLFDVPFEGSPWLFAVGALAFLVVALSFGLLVSTVSENQGQAVQLALMILLPQVMLSGLIFPLEAMAEPLQWIATVLPLTWFVQVARGVMVTGAGLAEVGQPLAVLVVMGVVVLTLATLRFRRELAPSDRRSRRAAAAVAAEVSA